MTVFVSWEAYLKYVTELTGPVEIECTVVVVFIGSGKVVSSLSPDLLVGAQHNHHEAAFLY